MTDQRGLAPGHHEMLGTLERLLAIEARDLDTALDAAAQAVAEALGADKVDAFMYDASTATLVARGTSDTPLGHKQRALGLHLLPLANGGRMVEVFQTGVARHCGRVDLDQEELRGIRESLAVRSDISVALDVGGTRGGVLGAVSTSPEFFSEADLRFLVTVARWVGIVAHRAQLAEGAAREAIARGRRIAAEELITVLAHDLRNLLTPLRMRLEMMGRRARRDGYEPYVRDADEMVRSADRLDGLVHELLDTARLEQGLFTLSVRPLDLVELVRRTISDFAPGAARMRAQHDELLVSGDPVRLRQAIENLLSNALKVQPPDDAVVVHVSSCESWAMVTVEDRGPGIPPDVLPRLFQRFTSGPGSVGLGLGLYLARGITEAHAGSLEVDSAPGRGTRFTMRLPLEPSSVARCVRTGDDDHSATERQSD
jgi:signal transduction histidine kinase